MTKLTEHERLMFRTIIYCMTFVMAAFCFVCAGFGLYDTGKAKGKAEIVDQIKSECQYAPSIINISDDDSIIVRYYPID